MLDYHVIHGRDRQLSNRTQNFGFHPEVSPAFPDVIASMVNYVVKPEAYFVTGKQNVVEFVCKIFKLSLNSTNTPRRWRSSSFLISVYYVIM